MLRAPLGPEADPGQYGDESAPPSPQLDPGARRRSLVGALGSLTSAHRHALTFVEYDRTRKRYVWESPAEHREAIARSTDRAAGFLARIVAIRAELDATRPTTCAALSPKRDAAPSSASRSAVCFRPCATTPRSPITPGWPCRALPPRRRRALPR